ncbi:non-canonical purine NTP pyrophosphatase [Roseibium sp. SCP14]|uniref:non-canonical purine NTP pyrophosphatase n=1 Tax=Roseibium sp. SCP14 TaxID=3141375 RepID=UPI00333C6C79
MSVSDAIPSDVFSAKLSIGASLVLATHNANKITALREALRNVPVEILTAKEFDLESPAETGSTVLENALIKARVVAQQSGHPAISDDSGFCISALDDLPGAAAIDWAGPNENYNIAIERIGEMLAERNIVSSPARFVTCIALALPDGTAIAEQGATAGNLVWPPRGATEGYLSVFALSGEAETLAVKMAGQSAGETHRIAAYRHRQPATLRLIDRVRFEG